MSKFMDVKKMFLKNIKLTNFRCLEDFEISFEKENGDIRQLTLVLGENGIGKSNLLKAIGMITAGSDAFAELLKNADMWIKNGKDFCEISAILVTKDKKERNLSIRINRNDNIREIIKRSEKTLEEIDNVIEHADRNYFVVGYGTSRRINSDNSVGRSAQEKSGKNRYSNISTLFDANAVLNPLESWAIDLDYRKGAEGLKTINMVLDEFLVGVKFV